MCLELGRADAGVWPDDGVHSRWEIQGLGFHLVSVLAPLEPLAIPEGLGGKLAAVLFHCILKWAISTSVG